MQDQLKQLQSLSPRESEVLALICTQHAYDEVAAALFIGERTVQYHMDNVYRKLGLRDLPRDARRLGLAPYCFILHPPVATAAPSPTTEQPPAPLTEQFRTSEHEEVSLPFVAENRAHDHQQLHLRRPGVVLPLAFVLLCLVIAAGALIRRQSDVRAATPTNTPIATLPHIVPGGKWIYPGPSFSIQSDQIRIAARAYTTTPTDPPIAFVNFTANVLGLEGGWRTACRITTVQPGTDDTYECIWQLPASVPNGPITLSFDVYDTQGNQNQAPNGVQRGTVER